MQEIKNELVELNDTLLKKSGTLPVNLENCIIHTFKDLSKDELKETLSKVDSKMMLNRIFTSCFSKNELEICFVIKEIFEERQGMENH